MNPDLAPILRAFSHELRQSLDLARTAAHQNQQALAWMTQKLNALEWLSAALIDESLAQQALSPCAVAEALGEIPQVGLKLRSNIPAHLSVLSAPGAFQTVLVALLSNVQKHTPKSQATVTARFLRPTAKPCPREARVTISGPKVLLAVTDYGPGIPAEMRSRLFEPISLGEWKLLRIGLWLSRLLVRAHGGELWLDETPRGASFSSVWPAPLSSF